MTRKFHLAVGLLALLLAFLSLYDLYTTSVHDGISPVVTVNGIVVDRVGPSSPAAVAGIRSGDRLLGISSTLISSPFSVSNLLERLPGSTANYLMEREGQVHTFAVPIEKKRSIRVFHILAGIVLIIFFLLGLIVFLNNPLGTESRIFYYLTLSLLLVFTCLLRPHSYPLSNLIIRLAGETAYILLPVLFLHFFLVYPQRNPILAGHPWRSWVLYLVPLIPALMDLGSIYLMGRVLIPFNWKWLSYGIFSLLSIGALMYSRKKAPPGEQTGLLKVYSVGIVLFIVFAIPLGINQNELDIAAVFSMPLMAVPVYLSYRIYRFGFFNIKILLKKSLLYSFILLLLSVVYAILIFLINTAFSRFSLTDPYLYSMGFAITIVFLFNPLHEFFRGQLEDIFLQKERQRKQTMTLEAEHMLNVTNRQVLEDRILELIGQVVPDRFALLVHTEHNSYRELRSGKLFELKRNCPDSRFFLLENATDGELYPFYQQGFRLAFPYRKSEQLRAILFTRTVLFEEELGAVHSMLLHFITSYENTRLLERLSHQLELERDIKIAGYIQRSLIPSHHPDTGFFEAYGVSMPSRVVGGDFFDYVDLPKEGQTGILIGDVAGKSIPAAMMMVAAKETIGSQAMVCREPKETMSLASQRLYEKSGANMFVAACYCVVDETEKKLTVVNAGMPAPLVVRNGQVQSMPRQSPRFPLGLVSDVHYHQHCMHIQPGDTVVILTDGVTEPLERELEQVVNRCPYGDARSFTAELMKQLRQKSGKNLEDDATIVTIMIKPFA